MGMADTGKSEGIIRVLTGDIKKDAPGWKIKKGALQWSQVFIQSARNRKFISGSMRTNLSDEDRRNLRRNKIILRILFAVVFGMFVLAGIIVYEIIF